VFDGIGLVMACLSAALIAAGGYVVNDVFDVEADRTNRPHRPIPRGDLSLFAARVWCTFLLLLGVAISWNISIPAGLMATCIAGALVWYAAALKRTVLWGHFLVAGISGSAFLYGGLLGENIFPALAPAFLATAFHLGREMLKAAADYPGDMEQGFSTMAVRWGVERTCRLSIMPLVAVIVASPWPYLLGWFGIFYLLCVLIVLDGILIYTIHRIHRWPTSDNAARLATLLKWNMVAGLVAVWGDIWTRS
jgi:geranylgeranylglycerol-phosphate geranylgeranyltransferase